MCACVHACVCACMWLCMRVYVYTYVTNDYEVVFQCEEETIHNREETAVLFEPLG